MSGYRPELVAEALQSEAAKPLYNERIRAQVAELVDLIHKRHDAAELLGIAQARLYGLGQTIRLFRAPRLVT